MPQELLRLSNFDYSNQSARSDIASYAAASQATVLLESSSGFTADRFVVIAPGAELAEIHQIDSISGNQLTLKANLFNTHQPGTDVLQLFGDQLKLYRADDLSGTTPTDDAFEHLEATSPTNPVAIQADQTFTALTDPDGGIAYWYKATYYNSVTFEETDLSLSLAVRGGDYGHFASLYDIREQAGFSIFDAVTDTQVDVARNQAESEIIARLGSMGYSLPIQAQVPILTSVAQMLGAGHLLRRSYGSGAEGTTKDGATLLKDGRAILDQLTAGTLQLVDIDGVVLSNTTGTSGSDESVSGSYREPSFRMERTF